MSKKITALTKKPFVRNVLVMATGTAAAQAIAMLLSPLITRLYGPEAFGVLGVFVALIGIITPIAALTYPTSIVLPKSDKEAKGIVKLAIYISIGIALFITFVLFLFNNKLVQLFNLESISQFLYLIPLVIIFSALLQVTENWLIRTKQFEVTAKVSFFHSVLTQGSKVVVGIFYPLASVLIFITALSEGIKSIMMIYISKKQKKLESALTEEKEISLKTIAYKYKSFPIYRAPQVFLNAISQNLPVIMLASFFGPAAAGFYSIGRTVLSIPTQLIGKSIGDVFYPRISEAANNKENLTKLIKKATFALAILGFIPFGLIILVGPQIFSFVFGNEWLKAGEYARWIALWVYFMFINQPSIKALPVLNAQAFHLRFTILTLVIRTSTIVLSYYIFSSDLIAIALFCISGAFLNLILILISLSISKKFDESRRIDIW